MSQKSKVCLIVSILALAFIAQSNDTTSVIMASLAAKFPDASPIALQFVMQMGMVGAFCVALCVGFLTRKFYIKHMLLVGALLILLGGISPLFFHGSLPILYAFAFIVGAGQGFLPSLLGATILKSFEGKLKDRMIGLNVTFNTLGSSILLLAAGPLVLSGWTNVYFIYLIAIPAFLIAFFLMPKGEKTPPPAVDDTKKIPVPPKAWIQSLMVVLMFVCYVSFPLNISMYVEGLGLGNAVDVSRAMMVIVIVGAVIGVAFQPLIKIVRLYVGTLAATFGFFALLLIVVSHHIYLIYVSAALLGVFFGAQMCSNGYIISRICKPEQIAPTFSIFSSFLMIGVISSPIIIGAVCSLWGGSGPLAAFTTAAIGFGILVVAQVIWNTYLTKTCPVVVSEQPAKD